MKRLRKHYTLYFPVTNKESITLMAMLAVGALPFRKYSYCQKKTYYKPKPPVEPIGVLDDVTPSNENIQYSSNVIIFAKPKMKKRTKLGLTGLAVIAGLTIAGCKDTPTDDQIIDPLKPCDNPELCLKEYNQIVAYLESRRYCDIIGCDETHQIQHKKDVIDIFAGKTRVYATGNNTEGKPMITHTLKDGTVVPCLKDPLCDKESGKYFYSTAGTFYTPLMQCNLFFSELHEKNCDFDVNKCIQTVFSGGTLSGGNPKESEKDIYKTKSTDLTK